MIQHFAKTQSSSVKLNISIDRKRGGLGQELEKMRGLPSKCIIKRESIDYLYGFREYIAFKSRSKKDIDLDVA